MHSLALLVALALLVPAHAAQKKDGKSDPKATAPGGHVEVVPKVGLTLTLPPAFTSVAPDPSEDDDEDDLFSCSAKLGEKDVWIDVEQWGNFARGEPSRVTWRIHDYVRGEDYEGPDFQFAEHKLAPGPYGYAPYASLLWGSFLERGTTKDIGNVWYLAGVTDASAYLLTVSIEPAASAAEREMVLAFLKNGVVHAGPAREFKWTDDEVSERWDKDSALSEKERKDLKVIRTAHYLVMTNSSGGDKFAKQMELNYTQIQKVYPFPEIPGRKLMPVFLFATADEYYAFYAKQFETSLEEASESKGVASGDFYATWYEAPNDPVHIHEATHQIFMNRLELFGAGSWFQEGVAEYIETKPNERNEVARRIKDGKHTPLAELMKLESLLGSSEDDVSGESAAALHYKQAALLIEFLRDSKFGKDKFLTWLHAMGNTADNDLAAIEAVFQRVYGVSIAQLDLELQKYCAKR
jgi:hypothetical protein